jgi:hypothetical protein
MQKVRGSNPLSSTVWCLKTSRTPRTLIGQGGGLRPLGAESFLQRLLEPLDFALGLGWFGLPFFCLTPRWRSPASRWLRPPLPPTSRVVKTRPLNVRIRNSRGQFPAAAPGARRCHYPPTRDAPYSDAVPCDFSCAVRPTSVLPVRW